MAPRAIIIRKPIRFNPVPVVGVWSEVQVGAGNMTGARRIITPTPSLYPNAAGVSFWLNDVFNRTDTTGPNEPGSGLYHFYLPPTLVEGDTLRASWTDTNGIFRESIYVVPVASVQPTALGQIGVTGAALGPNAVNVDGWPDDSNTGSRHATMLTSGTLTTSSNGQVIERHGGKVIVRHNNVTIRDCILNAGLYHVDLSTHLSTGAAITGTLIEYCTMRGADPGVGTGNVGVYYRSRPNNTTIRRCNISWMKSGAFGVVGSGLLLEDNWMHQNWYTTGSHSTITSLDDGSDIVYRGNHFYMPNPGSSSCTALYGRFPIDNVLYENNWYAGGSYAHNGGVGGKTYSPTNVTVRNNFFRTVLHPDCGQYGPIRSSGGHTVTGNVWHDPNNVHHIHLSPI